MLSIFYSSVGKIAYMRGKTFAADIEGGERLGDVFSNADLSSVSASPECTSSGELILQETTKLAKLGMICALTAVV